MQEETPTDWAETSTPELVNGTGPHTHAITNTNRRNENFFNTLYRLQHVDKQIKDVMNGQLQFGINREPNPASVPLNKKLNLEQLQRCSAAVPIQPHVQQYSHEQNLSIGHELRSPENACTDSLRWTDGIKFTKSIRAFKRSCNGKRRI